MRIALACAVFALCGLAPPALVAQQRPATMQVRARVVRSCGVNNGTLTCGRTQTPVPPPARQTTFVAASPAPASVQRPATSTSPSAESVTPPVGGRPAHQLVTINF